MALDKQIHIYSIDTSAFYNKQENKFHHKINNFCFYKNELIRKKEKYEKKYKKKFPNNKWEKDIKKKIRIINKKTKHEKKALVKKLKGNKNIRQLNKKYLIDKNVISVFESTLTRLLNIKIDSLSKELIIVQTYFFNVLEDIILNGFNLENEHYICLTASAGQIRTKKTVFIKENSFKKIEKSLTCGLTIDKINQHGGININKYLAYLALNNSATDYWKDFDIDKTIVVEDFETDVNGIVDLIDDETYTIEEKKHMKIPIPHTDGCGMILPKISKKCMMVRLPWVKGLLVPFPFDKFIREKSKGEKYCGVIKDIYGRKHDILKEKINIIFTASQFKMYKYFRNIINNKQKIKYGWEIYKRNFKKYHCQAGFCNVEEDKFTYAKLNYQMIQTLTDITDKELKTISKTTIDNIIKVGKNKETMLNILGVVPANKNKNYMQQALEIYPELLNDTYNKEILKQVKKSIVKQARAGKLDINGKYTFISPDLYAFCEFLFLHEKNPKGLLQNKEVWCKLYKDKNKIDCLRSPHLYREHAIRKNIAYQEGDKKRIKEIKRWFITNALYTSIHDIISKILMFDK